MGGLIREGDYFIFHSKRELVREGAHLRGGGGLNREIMVLQSTLFTISHHALPTVYHGHHDHH